MKPSADARCHKLVHNCMNVRSLLSIQADALTLADTKTYLSIKYLVVIIRSPQD